MSEETEEDDMQCLYCKAELDEGATLPFCDTAHEFLYRRKTSDDGNGHGFANGVAWNARNAPGVRKLDLTKPLVDYTNWHRK